MKKISSLLIIFTLLFIATGCNQKGKVDTIRIGSFSTAVDYAPYLIAKNKSWFDSAFIEKGLKVEYIEFQTLAPLNEALATNKVDVLFEAEPPAIVGKAAGIDVKIVDISCSITLGLLANPSASIDTVTALKNSKIALLAGTGTHYGVLDVLEKNGISKNDVEIIDMTPPDAKNAFETGKVDAWAVWSPYIDQEELNGKGIILPNTDFEIQSIMVARGKFLSENEDLFNIISEVFKKTKTWMLKNPEEAQFIVAKELGLDLSVIQRAWSRHHWDVELTSDIIQDIQNKADFLVNENFIEKQVDVKNDLIRSTTVSREKK